MIKKKWEAGPRERGLLVCGERSSFSLPPVNDGENEWCPAVRSYLLAPLVSIDLPLSNNISFRAGPVSSLSLTALTSFHRHFAIHIGRCSSDLLVFDPLYVQKSGRGTSSIGQPFLIDPFYFPIYQSVAANEPHHPKSSAVKSERQPIHLITYIMNGSACRER